MAKHVGSKAVVQSYFPLPTPYFQPTKNCWHPFRADDARSAGLPAHQNAAQETRGLKSRARDLVMKCTKPKIKRLKILCVLKRAVRA